MLLRKIIGHVHAETVAANRQISPAPGAAKGCAGFSRTGFRNKGITIINADIKDTGIIKGSRGNTLICSIPLQVVFTAIGDAFRSWPDGIIDDNRGICLGMVEGV